MEAWNIEWVWWGKVEAWNIEWVWWGEVEAWNIGLVWWGEVEAWPSPRLCRVARLLLSCPDVFLV